MADQERVAGILERYHIPRGLWDCPDIHWLAGQAAAEQALAEVYKAIYPHMDGSNAQAAMASARLCMEVARGYIDKMNELRIARDAPVTDETEREPASPERFEAL